MARFAFRMNIRRGTEEEYLRRHQQIWPEMLDALRRAGFQNYSIYRDGLTLVAYFEAEDPQETWARISAEPVNARWQEMMSDILIVEPDPATGFPVSLPEMFHLD
jgi:L-rhamnose mutarotase